MRIMVPPQPYDLCVAIPPTAFSVAGFRAWLESEHFPEQGRIEFCDGDVWIDMSPERAESHTLVKGEITRVLQGLVRSRDLGRIYADGVTFTNETAGIVTRPDGLFFGWGALREGRVRGGREHDDPVGVSGEVDWTLEVVSPSSVSKDRKRLFQSYHRAGVREYWIVDARGEEIDFEIYVAGARGYRPQPMVDGWRQSVVFGESFRLERSTDTGGGWQYTLSIR